VRTDLAARWSRLRPGADALGQDLLNRWSEPHRHYHTLDHLAAVLAVIDRYADLAADPDAVRLAAWFHDAVYDPRAADNEERSAELAERHLGDPEVARMVRLTAGHQVAPGDLNGALLADADLAILAAGPAAYDRYAAAVRREYGHVPEDAFRAGRARVLESLVALPELYRIVPPRATWDSLARANLARELAELKRS
jgi:predicted metal-dependent HD superfamily phosphohydrolase